MKTLIYSILLLTLAGCKIGEIEIKTPTKVTCTDDGFNVNDQGEIVVDEQGLALVCEVT